MTKKFFLLIILSMFFISSLTLFLILNYLDPYRDEVVSIFTLAFSFTIFITSFFSIIFYILKKVYYRGEVFLSHIFSSLRQAFFLAIFILGIILFKIIGVFSLLTILLFAIILVFIEMIFQNF
ncbi:hypothetical protein H3C61_03540 [Candidatus Gracilibacteria bacterium]|nr:hypothetical protein [Candidatus Gracilibacteria bacterium]